MKIIKIGKYKAIQGSRTGIEDGKRGKEVIVEKIITSLYIGEINNMQLDIKEIALVKDFDDISHFVENLLTENDKLKSGQ